MKKHKNKNKNKNMTQKDKVFSKFTTGRTKSIKKRKNTLLLEYKLRNKVNKFYDRRIGEKNRNMTSEDKVMARFVAQRVKVHKKEIFNLGGDDEVLTHQGRSLLDIEKFDNPQIDDSDEDDDGKLDANFVKEAHFGGGLFTKVTPGSSSHQSTIDQLIAESKKKKAERQQIKEETQNLTDKLDKDLKDLFPLVADSSKGEEEWKPNKESYDVLVRELKFEPVGRPSDKLKSEEQIRNEEKQRLQKLEEERLQRMKRTIEPTPENEDEPPQKKHQSADDLDDGLDLDVFDEEDEDQNDDDDEDDDDEAEDEEEEEESDNDEKDDPVEKTEVEKPSVKKSKALVPENLTTLKNLLADHETDKKIDLIKEAVKNQQIHTGVSNVDHLMTFFNLLLEYIDELFNNREKECWNFASKLAPILFDLVQVSGDRAAQTVFNAVKNKNSKFTANAKQGVTPDMLIILKLVPILFPTSDYYHPVATPATAFLSHVMSQNSCKNGQMISQGLFCTTVMLEYVWLSNRYCPEAINFLKCVLYTAIPNVQEAIPPVNSKNKILTLKNDQSKNDISPVKLQLSYSNLTNETELKDEDKLKLIFTTLELLSAFVKHYNDLPATYAIWAPVMKQLNQLPVNSYPKCCLDKVVELQLKINDTMKRPIEYLMAERKRPKALRLYEPNIREVIDGQSFRTVSQAKLERDKLLHEYKREMKGAIREIRKDKNFLARVKLSEQAQKDAERKAKVKQIFNWGQNQQSELKRMERKNRYRH